MNPGEPLTWRNETRRLSELVPWERNPRQIKDAEAKRLGESLLQFGQVQTVAIGPDNQIYDGHQRALVWSLLQEGGDREVDVRVSSRALTEKEREKLVVYLHKGAAGEWDFEALANGFDFDELVEWGFDAGELTGFDMPTEESGGIDTIPEKYMIMIECENEQSQAELLERFESEGLKCRALL